MEGCIKELTSIEKIICDLEKTVKRCQQRIEQHETTITEAKSRIKKEYSQIEDFNLIIEKLKS